MIDTSGLSDKSVARLSEMAQRLRAEEADSAKYETVAASHPELVDRYRDLRKKYNDLQKEKRTASYSIVLDGDTIAQGDVSISCIPEPTWVFEEFIKRSFRGDVMGFSLEGDGLHPIYVALRRGRSAVPAAAIRLKWFADEWGYFIVRVNEWCQEAVLAGVEPCRFAQEIEVREVFP